MKYFQNHQMRSRSTRFTILSMSLSPLLPPSSSSASDNYSSNQQQQPAGEFLRSLLNVLQEFDQIPEEKFGNLINSNHNGGGAFGLGLGGNGVAGGGGGIGGTTSGNLGGGGSKSVRS